MPSVVVVHDPEGVEAEGEILEGQRAEVARSRGIAVLPVVPALLRRNAFAGWARRAYGRGWRYDAARGSRGCPLTLHVAADHPTIHWTARIVRDETLGEPSGTLRFATDTAQISSSATGIINEENPPNLATLGAPDAHGGWTISGRAQANVPGDTFLAFQLFGQLAGARVAWFAASQTA
jgi:hypothetical protein